MQKTTIAPLRSLLLLIIGIIFTFYVAYSFVDVSKRVSTIIERDMNEIERIMQNNMDVKLDQYEGMLNVIKILIESTSSSINISENKSRVILLNTIKDLIESDNGILALSVTPFSGETIWAFNQNELFSELTLSCNNKIETCLAIEQSNFEINNHYFVKNELFYFSVPIKSKIFSSINIFYQLSDIGIQEILNSNYEYKIISETSLNDFNTFEIETSKILFGKSLLTLKDSKEEHLSNDFFYERITHYPKTFITTFRWEVFDDFLKSLFRSIAQAFLISLITYVSFILIISRRIHAVESAHKTQQLIKSQDESIVQHETTLSLINSIPIGVILAKEDLGIHSISDAIGPLMVSNKIVSKDLKIIFSTSFINEMIVSGQHEKEVKFGSASGSKVILAFNIIDLKKVSPFEYRQQRDVSGVRYIITSNDVSNEFNLRQELKQKVLEQTREIQQLLMKEKEDNKSKSVFLSTVSHEMRTPLNGINGAIELIHTNSLSNKDKRYFDMIRSSSENLLRMVNDLLDFTKIQAKKLEFVQKRFDIIERVEKVVQSLSISKKKNVKVFIDNIAITESTVIGDPLRFEQVLNNLLSNAFKFTSFGYIRVTISQIHKDNKTIKYFIDVTDTGVGIPKEKQANIFQRFTQATSDVQHTHGGTGLGLAISKSLCHLMGGDLEINSTVRKGSTFTASFNFKRPSIASYNTFRPKNLYLPIFKGTDYEVMINHCLMNYGFGLSFSDMDKCQGTFIVNNKVNRIVDINTFPEPVVIYSECPVRIINGHAHVIYSPSLSLREVTSLLNGIQFTQTDSQTNDELSSFDFNQLKVLVVDDNETNRIVIRGFLESLNCVVDEAEDGDYAIEKTLSFQPSLILMDLSMPNKDGIEATKYLRANFPDLDLPIFALTAAVMAGDRERCLDAGMDGFLTKPISSNELIEVLKSKFNFIQQNSLFSSNITPVSTQIQTDKALSNSTTHVSEPTANIVHIWNEEAFRKRLNYSETLINKVLNSFLQRWKGKLAELTISYNDNSETVCKAAHAFKGLASEIQAERLTACLLNIEKNASTGEVNSHDIHQVNEELTVLVKQLPVIEK